MSDKEEAAPHRGFGIDHHGSPTGAGGFDRGFPNAGFKVPWADEHDMSSRATNRHNFSETKLYKRSIVEVAPDDIPDYDGMIGGPRSLKQVFRTCRSSPTSRRPPMHLSFCRRQKEGQSSMRVKPRECPAL
jgi:hypothetical protein